LFGEENGIFPDWCELPFIMIVTTVIWLIATFMTQPESNEVLRRFYIKIQPGGPGWSKVVNEAKADNVAVVTSEEKWSVPSGILAMLLGVALIYSLMFATGYWIYGKKTWAIVLSIVALVSGILLVKAWRKIRNTIL